MVNFRPLLVGFLLAGLFAIALLNFGILLAENNGVDHSIGDDPAISSYKDNLEDTLDTAYSNATGAEESLGKSPVSFISQNIIFDAIGGIWKTLKEVPITVYNLTFGLLSQKLFGDSSYGIVLAIISTIITITVIFGVWKMVFTGDSG